MKTKVLFIDRDGTIIKEPEDEQIDSVKKFELLPNVISVLKNLSQRSEFKLVMVTNQDGLGTEQYPEEKFILIQTILERIFESEGIIFEDIFIDRSFPEDGLNTRKPGTGMLNKYLYGEYDLANSFVIGDRTSDVLLAKNLKAKSIFIGDETLLEADFTSNNWIDIQSYLMGNDRTAKLIRNTTETQISATVNLDGKGISNIKTDLKFLNHMLEQIPRHSQIDLSIFAKGDIEIDDHHLVEDTGIILGELIKEALGSKKGIERYDFLLPMDESLCQIALDLGGRAELVWNCDFKKDKIGDVSSEMFKHFFKSLSESLKCNLNISCEGENEHHKIESIFKAFAKCLGRAVKRTNSNLPSTKGVL